MPSIQNGEYFPNCRLAITSSELLNNAIQFYNEVLGVKESNAPVVEAPLPEEEIKEAVIPVNEEPEIIDIVPSADTEVAVETPQEDAMENMPNPQMQILSSTPEPEPEIPVFINNEEEKKEEKPKNDGFAINASIVIGTVAIVLAVVIVTVTFIVIKKMVM